MNQIIVFKRSSFEQRDNKKSHEDIECDYCYPCEEDANFFCYVIGEELYFVNADSVLCTKKKDV